MSTYIVDTNILFNMEANMGLGPTTQEILQNLVKILPLANKKEEELLMPPAIVQEIESFFDNQDDALLNTFLGFVTVRSPSYHDIAVSGDIFNDLIEDYRLR